MENKEEKSENLDNQIAPPPADDQSVVIDGDQTAANTEPASDTSVPQASPQSDTNPPVGISTSEEPIVPEPDAPVNDAPSVQADMPSSENPLEATTHNIEMPIYEHNTPIAQEKPSILANPTPPTAPQNAQSNKIKTAKPEEILTQPAIDTQSSPQNISQSAPQIVIKEVIKEVPVEKIVEKEIIKEVPVEKIVIKEVPVEKIVEKIVEKEVKVFDQERFTEEIRKRALSLLPHALQSKKMKKDMRIERVYEYIKSQRSATTGHIQKHLHLSAMTVFRYTNTLITQNRITFSGHRRARIYSAV